MKDIWRKGKVVDLWSIPHFLWGALCAFVPFFTAINAFDSFFIMLFLALLWEVYEKFVGIVETVWNNIMDMILPMLAFLLMIKILDYYNLHNQDLWVIFWAMLAIYSFTNISGWLAYRRRQKEFMS